MEMSSSKGYGRWYAGNLRRIIAGAVLIVVQAAAIGLAANALNPQRLPWVRVPLKDTRRLATTQEVVPTSPDAIPPDKSSISVPAPLPGNAVEPVLPPKSAPTPDAAEAPKPVQPNSAAKPPAPSSEPSRTPQPVVKPKKVEALFTTLCDAKALFDRKAAVFVDTRHKEDYGFEHVLGARSLFVEDLDKLYESVLGSIPKDRTIVTYCSDAQCETAIKLADALVARGHTRVFILMEGLPGWKEAGYPTAGAGVQ